VRGERFEVREVRGWVLEDVNCWFFEIFVFNLDKIEASSSFISNYLMLIYVHWLLGCRINEVTTI